LIGFFWGFEGIRGDFPLAKVAVHFVDLLLITLLFGEPVDILRLFHNDLDSSTRLVELAVNRRYEVFRRIYFRWWCGAASVFAQMPRHFAAH
jgi:hypothetical protein